MIFCTSNLEYLSSGVLSSEKSTTQHGRIIFDKHERLIQSYNHYTFCEILFLPFTYACCINIPVKKTHCIIITSPIYETGVHDHNISKQDWYKVVHIIINTTLISNTWILQKKCK